MPIKTRHQIRQQESRGQPATPPTSLPLPSRRPRRAAARGPTPATEASGVTKPQRGRRRKAVPAQESAEPSAESASASVVESVPETVPNNEQDTAVVTGSPERDNAVYQNRENPTLSLNPTLVPEDDAVQSPREKTSISLTPTVVPKNNKGRSVHKKSSVSLVPDPIIEDEDDSMGSPLDSHHPPQGRWPPSRSWRLRNAFTFDVVPDSPITLRDPVEPEAPQNTFDVVNNSPITSKDTVEPEAPRNTLHLLVTGPDGERNMAFTLPATAVNAIIHDLTSKYKLVADAPKLTLDAGKREAPTIMDLDRTRPAQQRRFDNAPRFDDAMKGKVSHPNWSHLQKEYYQQRQDKPGHTQHYRMVEPRYDENGMMAWPREDEHRRFIPILDEADDSDLDTELDDASSSFKENIPAISENNRIENIEDSEPSDALVNSSGAGAHILEESAIVLRESDRDDENARDAPAAPAVLVPETPRSRWALGNIINTASKYIPRLGRVAEDPLPTGAGPAFILPTENPATPIRPTSPAQIIAPQTEPHHQTRTPSASKPDRKPKRATSVNNYHIYGPPKTKEERARLNVRRRQEKVKKRQELTQMETKLDARRAAILNQEQQLRIRKADFEAKMAKAKETIDLEAYEANTREGKEKYELEVDGVKLRLRSMEKFDRERVKGPLFGPPRAPNAPGSRIKEARAEGKRKRRELSPKVIPGPVGGGYGMNEKYFMYSDSDSDDETAADSPRTKKARLEEAKDSSLPIGDPFQARPATGSYFNEEGNESQLHGGNVYREVDAIEDTTARVAKAKGSVSKMPPMTPDGKQITNLSGHFTVPYSSGSETGSDEDAVDIPTPAPKRTVKESLSEMSMFRKDARERAASTPSQNSMDPPARAESLPPIPPAPTPAHASLPEQPRKYTPVPGFKTSERTLKFLHAAQVKSDKLRDEQEKLRAVRAKALQFTPRRSSNLRESHLVDSSPSASSGHGTAGPSAPSGKRVHFADDLISGPSGTSAPETSRTAISELPNVITEPSSIVSDPSQAVSQPSRASPETAQVITGPAQASPAHAPVFSWPRPVFPEPAQQASAGAVQASAGTTQASPGQAPALSWSPPTYPGPTQATQAFAGPAPSLADENTTIDDVSRTRYPKDEMISFGGMEVRGEILNLATDSVRDEDVEHELSQIRKEFAQYASENPSRRPEVTARVQEFLDSAACREAVEDDSGPIAEGIRAGMARDIFL